uniref:cytochrome-c oxidase n=1 Tax=Heliconema longissimum TaxID=657295 RepID=G4V234_9BILA|nr:cytochrome c oxidase subunit II [Heliconema longissimum]ACV96721.1 cytochrome c oxidase subunit II [Heliconema longissimum]
MFFDGYTFLLPISKFSYGYHFIHAHYTHFILFGVVVMISFIMMMYFCSFTFKFNSNFNDGRMIEFIMKWLPANFLIFVISPGFWLIQYQGSMLNNSDLNIKVLGHQWYWSYEYSDVPGLMFDSFMKPTDELLSGEYRLLEVDNRCVLPFNINIGFFSSSTDVVHSFCVPKCSIKLDVFNGLLSNFFYYFPIPGVYYGQCFELCGSGHSFMPIVLEVNSMECGKVWALSYLS